MASSLPMSVGRNLSWETTVPTASSRHESSIFTYMDMKWKLLFDLKAFDNKYHYYIVLINCNKTKGFTPFSVTTYLQRKGNYPDLYCSSSTVNYGFEFLYYEKSQTLKNKLSFTNSDYTSHVYVTITCVFCPPSGLFLDMKIQEKAEVSKQVSDECFESQNKLKIEDSSKNASTMSLVPFPHFESLSKDFSDMLQKGILTDVELKCGEVSIPAHRAVLASRSKIFSSMFEHQMTESITGSVDIEDIEPSTLQEFLKYLYSGKVSDDLPVKLIVELYKTGDKYAVLSFQQGCRDMLVRNLTEENCIDFLTLAEKHCDDELRDTVAGFIIERPEVLKSDAWFEFSDNFSKLANSIYKRYVAKTT